MMQKENRNKKESGDDNFEAQEEDSKNGSGVDNINDRKSKHLVVVEGGETIHEQINTINKKKTPNDNTFIITCLKNHFVFYNLNEAELENIVKKMFYCEVV